MAGIAAGGPRAAVARVQRIDAPPERAATHRTNRAVACILVRSDAQEMQNAAEAMPGDQLRVLTRILADLRLSRYLALRALDRLLVSYCALRLCSFFSYEADAHLIKTQSIEKARTS